jgi:hypothetical protein
MHFGNFLLTLTINITKKKFFLNRCLVAVTEKYFFPNYFDSGLIGAQVDQKCLKDIIKSKFPDLHKHLESLDIDISSITLNWFLAIFIDSVPFDTLLRIWDCFLLEGSKVLFRVRKSKN